MNEKIETLEMAYDYILKLESGVEKLVLYYQNYNLEEGHGLLRPVLEGIEWMMDAIKLTIDIQENKSDIEEMQKPLEYVIDAVDNEDWFYLSEVFEYEILPILKRWKSNIAISIGA